MCLRHPFWLDIGPFFASRVQKAPVATLTHRYCSTGAKKKQQKKYKKQKERRAGKEVEEVQNRGDFVSAVKAAEMMGVSRVAVSRMIEEGVLRAQRLNDRVKASKFMIPIEDVEAQIRRIRGG